ncbi:MAG: DUF721 domain-containing protein [Bacteriovoracales bacterium]|nr:DUF721 domain-containing protein [Bacteriovoracales bacterium]
MGFKSLGEVLSDQGHGPHTSRGSRKKKWGKGRGKKGAHNFFNFLHLVKSWPQIVGFKLSKETLPLKIRRDKLFIMTSHPLYAQQLQHFEKEILAKVKAFFPHTQTPIQKLLFEAGEGLDEIKSEQKNILRHKGMGEEQEGEEGEREGEQDGFHPFDPHYLKAKRKARAEIPPMDDPALSSLLEKINIKHYLQKTED